MKPKLLKKSNIPLFCFGIELSEGYYHRFLSLTLAMTRSKMVEKVKGVVKNLSSINFKENRTLNSSKKVLRRKYEAKSEIPTKVLERVFDPFDERWVFIDEPTPDCLSCHEDIRIVKNVGGEKE